LFVASILNWAILNEIRPKMETKITPSAQNGHKDNTWHEIHLLLCKMDDQRLGAEDNVRFDNALAAQNRLAPYDAPHMSRRANTHSVLVTFGGVPVGEFDALVYMVAARTSTAAALAEDIRAMLLFATTATTGPISVIHQAARMVAEANLARRERFSATDATQLLQLNGEVNAANAQVPVTCPMLWIIASALSVRFRPGDANLWQVATLELSLKSQIEALELEQTQVGVRSVDLCRELCPAFCTVSCAMHRVAPGACPYSHSRAYRRLRAGLFPSVSCCRSCWRVS
jgi:hypothetical protein